MYFKFQILLFWHFFSYFGRHFTLYCLHLNSFYLKVWNCKSVNVCRLQKVFRISHVQLVHICHTPRCCHVTWSHKHHLHGPRGEINTCKSSQCQTPQVSRPGSTIPGPAIVHHGLDDEDNTLKDGGYIGGWGSRGYVSYFLSCFRHIHIQYLVCYGFKGRFYICIFSRLRVKWKNQNFN